MSERRKVSVSLEVKAAEARKDIKGLRDDAAGLDKSAREAGRGLDQMGDKARKSGRETEVAAGKTKIAKIEAEAYKRELGSLDRQIDATVLHLKVLGREFEATGSKATLGKISAERAMLRRLQQIRKDLTLNEPPVPTGGGGFAPPVSPVLIAAIVAAVAAAAPGIGAIIGGATLGGIGAGGIVGGVVAAAHDGRVKDAFAQMGGNLKESFFKSGQPFLGPLLHETAQLQATAGSAINILRKGFADLAPVLHPLVMGLDGFIEALGPGMDSAFKAAKPLLRAFANELPRIGSAISDALDDIAGGSEGGVEGMVALSRAIEGLIRGTGAFIRAMEDTYAWLVRNTAAITDFGLKAAQGIAWLKDIPFAGQVFGALYNKIKDVNEQTHGYLDAAKAAGDASKDFAYDLDGTARSAADTAQAVKDLNDELETQLGIVLGVREAQIRLNEKWDEAVKTIGDSIRKHEAGARSLDRNTEAGRKNEQMLIDLIQAADKVRDATVRSTGNLDQASKAYDAQIEKIRKLATGMGLAKNKVDALIESVRTAALQKGINIGVSSPGLVTVQSRLNKVEDTLDRLDGRVVRSTYLIQEQHREDSRLYRRWGGISEREAGAYQHAADGRLREAAVYSAASPARYAYAEPATGGEAFVPRKGDYGRSMSILSRAARWYGASVVPMAGAVRAGGTTTVVHEHRHTLVVEGTGVLSGLRREIGLLGGDVQSALGARTRVGG